MIVTWRIMGHRPSDLDRVDHEATFLTILGGNKDLLRGKPLGKGLFGRPRMRWGLILIWITISSIRCDIQPEFAIIRPPQYAEFD